MINRCVRCGAFTESGKPFCNKCMNFVPNMDAFYQGNRKFFSPPNPLGPIGMIVGGAVTDLICFSILAENQQQEVSETLNYLMVLLVGVVLIVFGIKWGKHLNDGVPSEQEIDQLFAVKECQIKEQVEERLGIDPEIFF